MKSLKYQHIEIGINQLNDIITKHYGAESCFTEQINLSGVQFRLGKGSYCAITVRLGEEVEDADNPENKADSDA